MIRRFVVPALLLTLLLAAAPAPTGASSSRGGCSSTPRYGCTVFLAANDTVSLGGNNEDWRNPFTKLWFIPAREDTFGQMYVGYDEYTPQGGMNDQGLFFDSMSLPQTIVPPQTGKPDLPNDALSILMGTCANVQCVVDYLDEHDRTQLTSAQILFGDASGDAVIVEPIEMIRKDGAFLVSTNFLQSATPPDEITCERFETAQAILTEANGDFTVDLFRQILAATHDEGEFPTQYSNVYDLKAGTMYLYLFHDYEHMVEINLADELAQGIHEYDIPSLFPENSEQAAFSGQAWSNYRAFLESQGYDPETDTSDFQSFAGRYSVPTLLRESGAVVADYLEVTWQDELLYYDFPGDVRMPMPLYPISPTTFISSSYDAEAFLGNAIFLKAEFLHDAENQISGLRGDFGGAMFDFARLP